MISGLVGLIFIFLILSYLVFPAISYDSFKPEPLKDILFSENNEIDERAKKRLFLMPMLIYIILSISAINIYSPNTNNGLGLFIGWLILVLVCTVLAFNYHIVKEAKEFKIKNLFQYILIISSSYLFMLFSFIISVSILQNSEDFKNNSLTYSIVLGAFIFIFLAINMKAKEYFERVTISIIFLILLLFLTKTYHVIPFAIMKTFNLGQVTIKSLSVDKKGCEILGNNSSKQCEIKDIILIWRSGKDFVIQEKNQDNKKEILRYYIPNKSIIAWSQESKKEAKNK